jgi:hypothetical protein
LAISLGSKQLARMQADFAPAVSKGFDHLCWALTERKTTNN